MSQALRNAVRDHLNPYRDPCRDNRRWITALALAPLLAAAPMTATLAQERAAMSLEEIIVTARRRDENIQDVPVTVNVVTGEMVEDMNIRRFEDLQTLVAGLELTDRPVGPLASMRGVRFDAFASGNNPSVEFYLNDVLMGSNVAMNSMFDIGMIEVLRGPQGTLRGRASPSGSIIMTTKRPDLERFTGDIDITATNEGGENIRGGLSIPIIEDMLAVRLAGFVEENRINHARSFRTGERAKMENDGWRVSVRFEPTDSLAINAYYQEVDTDRWQLTTVESANILDGSLPPSPVEVDAGDRLSAQNMSTTNFATLERTGLEVEWDAGPVVINYSGALTESQFRNTAAGDTVGFYDASYPEVLQNFVSQAVLSSPEAENHELRFSGDITDKLRYVVGGFYYDFDSPTEVDAFTPVFLFGTGPANFLLVNQTPVLSQNESLEKSYFGNLTYQLSDATELSAGLRYIDYEAELSTRVVGGGILGASVEDTTTTIYTVSLAHNFTDDLMGYITAGSSWRPSVQQVGNSDTQRTAREQGFLGVGPEESDSIEFGIKSTWLDQRLRLNGTIFYQKFDDYPDRGLGGGVRFVNADITGAETVSSDTFVAGVELDTYGFELDGSFQITDNLDISGTYSWAQGTQDGTVACNDYFPVDGVPDEANPPITVDQIRAATGGEDIASCSLSVRSYEGPTWSTSFRTEYSFPMFNELGGYLRLQTRIFGAAKGSPTNPDDEVSSYALFDLYAGIRSPEENWGNWEVMVFAKNLLDTDRRLSLGNDPINTSLRVVPTGAVQIPSSYRTVSVTAPREIGLNLRYNF